MRVNEQNSAIVAMVRKQFLTITDDPNTCIGCIKVLSQVLKETWDIELTPHIVDLKVLPPEVLSIFNSQDLNLNDQLINLPPGKRQIRIESCESFDGHLVGTCSIGNRHFFWDPSIDQVNRQLTSGRLKPFCVETDVQNGGNLTIEVFGCLLKYDTRSEFDAEVYGSTAWNDDYTKLVRSIRSGINAGEMVLDGIDS